MKKRAGITLALCITLTGCGETPDILTNAAVGTTTNAIEPTAVSDPFVVDPIDQKPRKILSPDERRRADALLRIYRESSSDESLADREKAAAALDDIDPRILQNERAREAARQTEEANRSVDDMIREHERKRANAT